MVAKPLGSAIATRSPGAIPAPCKAPAMVITCSRKESYEIRAPDSGRISAVAPPGATSITSNKVFTLPGYTQLTRSLLSCFNGML